MMRGMKIAALFTAVVLFAADKPVAAPTIPADLKESYLIAIFTSSELSRQFQQMLTPQQVTLQTQLTGAQATVQSEYQKLKAICGAARSPQINFQTRSISCLDDMTTAGK
jgi:hypothetical protein